MHDKEQAIDLKKPQLGLSFEGSHWARSPQPSPKESPMATSIGPCKASWRVSAFSLKLMPKKMPNLGGTMIGKKDDKTNPEMATTSSAAHAEITRVGTPLATPYPLSERLIRQGMMTAGETAARTKPSMKPTVQGKPRMKWERQATAAASTKQGMKVARMT